MIQRPPVVKADSKAVNPSSDANIASGLTSESTVSGKFPQQINVDCIKEYVLRYHVTCVEIEYDMHADLARDEICKASSLATRNNNEAKAFDCAAQKSLALLAFTNRMLFFIRIPNIINKRTRKSHISSVTSAQLRCAAETAGGGRSNGEL